MPEPLEHAHDRLRRLRKQRVAEAGDEEANPHEPYRATPAGRTLTAVIRRRRVLRARSRRDGLRNRAQALESVGTPEKRTNPGARRYVGYASFPPLGGRLQSHRERCLAGPHDSGNEQVRRSTPRWPLCVATPAARAPRRTSWSRPRGDRRSGGVRHAPLRETLLASRQLSADHRSPQRRAIEGEVAAEASTRSARPRTPEPLVGSRRPSRCLGSRPRRSRLSLTLRPAPRMRRRASQHS